MAVQVGEDAYFVRPDSVGVADGVGGWAKRCIPADGTSPSALFARRLMHYTAQQLELDAQQDEELDLQAHLEELEEGIDVLSIMERAYESTVKAHAPERDGSSTALVAVLEAEEEEEALSLKVAQVGDCMGMVVRGEEIVWRSEEMWWAWNTPVQLGMPPSSPSSTSPKNEPQEVRITPRTLARLDSVPVRADDILILASDGLSDNLWDEDVLDEVVRCRRSFLGGSTSSSPSCSTSPSSTSSPNLPTPPTTTPKHTTPTIQTHMHDLRRKTLAGTLSEALCSRARRVSDSRTRLFNGVVWGRELKEGDQTPFAVRAKEAGKVWRGGKRDGEIFALLFLSGAHDSCRYFGGGGHC
ncbi:hypothetical protein C0991_008976 [Blastosporella zonata]|nr:hypothetical protein C0991_008976 [Blastosporella zonata]